MRRRVLLSLMLVACMLPAVTVAQQSPCPSDTDEPWAQLVLRTNGHLNVTQKMLGLYYLGTDESSIALADVWQGVAAEWQVSSFPDDLTVLQFTGSRLADQMAATLGLIRQGDETDADKAVLASAITAYEDALVDVGFGFANCPLQTLGDLQSSAPTLSTQVAEAQATITAQATEMASLNQILSQIESIQEEIATAEAAQSAAVAAQSTVDAQAAGIEPTVIAVSTQAAASNATATALAQQAAQGSIDPSKVELSIDVDYDGLINGDPDAIEETSNALADVLAPYDGCRVGLSLTFGWSSDLSTGIAVAQAVNQILADDFPKIFGDAALEDFASLQDPPGRVDLELFLYKGCDALAL